ncbi:sterol desaturase family protein [Rhodanobacter sp. MP1X3]|uniref:sterol desaturase family protein n=1 Tax=Rhodanobacter sp. MP1X3 TaxID=2723086 RepID=UPI001622F23B|nr:sterol desaturase family protein [Rhodanobacter sp. MP1X3]MBB6240985.1 sterol desaturase/sphingolipid hydroxylase (fatty acid hydroxylase superfamily) [Rhodanobacter sp. MP1X3]
MTPERIMAWAIPGFFVLIAIEFAVARWRGHKAYRSNDAINSLGLGVISQIVGVLSKLLSVGIYAWCVQHLGVFHLAANSVWVWLSALLLYDFLYYWLHRMGHEVNVLWAAHVVHHQSEDYNLTTALRQTGSGVLLGWLFYLPMALLGYPVEVFVVVALIDLLYQFWVHTGEIDKLGWFDRVFCSPSNHRAHHAVNDRYLDKNYGGILILWDRLFGTFTEENDSEPPVFGTRSPLQSWNPLWANAEVYWAMVQDAWHAERWRDKLQLWFRPPGWRPADVAARFPKPAFDIDHPRYDPPMSRGFTVYLLLQFALLLGMSIHFLTLVPVAPLPTLLLYAGYLVASLCVLGILMEGRRSATWLEGVRVLATALVPVLSGKWFGIPHLDGYMMLAIAVVFGLSALALPWLHGGQRGLSLHDGAAPV